MTSKLTSIIFAFLAGAVLADDSAHNTLVLYSRSWYANRLAYVDLSKTIITSNKRTNYLVDKYCSDSKKQKTNTFLCENPFFLGLIYFSDYFNKNGDNHLTIGIKRKEGTIYFPYKIAAMFKTDF